MRFIMDWASMKCHPGVSTGTPKRSRWRRSYEMRAADCNVRGLTPCPSPEEMGGVLSKFAVDLGNPLIAKHHPFAPDSYGTQLVPKASRGQITNRNSISTNLPKPTLNYFPISWAVHLYWSR